MPKKTDKPGSNFKKQLQRKSLSRRKQLASEVETEAIASELPRNDLLPERILIKLPISEIRPGRYRTRAQSEAQLQRVMKSISADGQLGAILLDKDHHIIDGHIVLAAAKKLGATEIWCMIFPHLSELRAVRSGISINRIQELGEWYHPELREAFIELLDHEITLEPTGFTVIERDQIVIGDPEDEKELDEQLNLPDDPPVSLFGDLFLFGEAGHKLLVGDALKRESYDVLLEGKLARGVFSDPPYNCPIKGFVGGLGKHQHQNFLMASGEQSDPEFIDFLATYLAHCMVSTSPGAVIFACMDWRQIDLLLIAGRLVGLDRINKAVWNKGSGSMGSLYRSAYEEVAVFCNGPTPATNNVQLGRHGRDRMNVWSYPGANRKGSSANDELGSHPTPKPVELVRDALLDVTNQGDIVLDPFMGSGTTIIATHLCDRIAYGIEYDPRYVDVAIRRFQKRFNLDVIHAQTGMTFRALEAERKMGGQEEDDIAAE